MRPLSTILVLVLCISSCQTSSKGDAKDIQEANSLPRPTDSEAMYFPGKPNSFTSDTLDRFSNKWYSEHLFSLHEPVLFSVEVKSEIYRFTLLRTFQNPITVRIQKSDNNCLLTVKRTNGAGGYDPGEIILDKVYRVSKGKWERFIGLINQINFWRIPSEEGVNGQDGSRWILEGYKDGKYHFTDRWSPSGEYEQCCMYLLKLAKVKLDNLEIQPVD